MYTVEFKPDASIITSLDETNLCDDIEMVLADDGIVFLRQFEEEMNSHQLITITYQQLLDLFAAMQSPEGAYYVERYIKSDRNPGPTITLG